MAVAAPRPRRWEYAYPVPPTLSPSDMPGLMSRIWRLTAAAGLLIFHPESLPEMEAAWAGCWPLAVVDEVTKDAGDPREWDHFALGLRLRQVAEFPPAWRLSHTTYGIPQPPDGERTASIS